MRQDSTLEAHYGRPPRRGLPNLGLGVGLRNQHFSYLMNHEPEVDWFEIISENFIDNYGYARNVLKHRDPDGKEPVKPKDSELRLAFPPST